MRKNFIPIICTVAIISMFSSCKKSDTASQVVTSRLKTLTEVVNGTNTTYNFTYDPSGKMLDYTAVSPGMGKFIFQYSTNSYTLDILDGINYSIVRIHEDFFLNNNQLIDSTYQYNDTRDTGTEKMTYNSVNQLIEKKTYNYSHYNGLQLLYTNIYNYDNNGNVITDEKRDATGTVKTITRYTYNNILNSIFSFPDNGLLQYKYLPVTQTETDPGNTYTVLLIHEYTYDEHNRVITEKLSQNGLIGWKYYSYY